MENLRTLRKQAGLTMKQLGANLGMAESTVSLYENGKRSPDVQTLIRFADFFDVSLDYLLGRNEGHVSAANDEMTDEEKELLRIFRGLNGKGKDSILEYARERTEIPSMKEATLSKETA